MKLSTYGKERDLLGFQLSVFSALIFVVMGILLGAASTLIERVRLGPKGTQTMSRMATWLRERTGLGFLRPEP